MCMFFSFVMNDKGKIFYFNREQRLEFEKENPKWYEMDSHASICDYFNLDDFAVNKYEYLGTIKEDYKCFDLDEEKQKIMDDFISNLDLSELVVNSQTAYHYCFAIKDDPKIRNKIKTTYYKQLYRAQILNDIKNN